MDSRIFKIALSVFLSVVLIYVIVDVFFYGNKQASSFSKAKVNDISTDPMEARMDKILVNTRGKKFKYVKVDMSFEMRDKDQKEDLMNNMQQVRTLILNYTSKLDADKLMSEQGKEEYKKEIITMLYDNFGYRIEAVYFRNFVLAP
ncbi:MAG: flagellar basal body-associated FliL family protein [Sulfurospirillaceae bacterium]|nr:flagellar basal body-associated FliL family protein [Sulfurospirillaceae bacterium]